MVTGQHCIEQAQQGVDPRTIEGFDNLPSGLKFQAAVWYERHQQEIPMDTGNPKDQLSLADVNKLKGEFLS